MNYKDTVENLIKEKESTSALLIKSSNEVDKLNLDVNINKFFIIILINLKKTFIANKFEC